MINTKKSLLLLLALTFAAVFPVRGNPAEEWDYGADADALTRGPLHEAYAQPVTVDVDNRFVVNQKPPEPIQEIPPDEKPAGDNVVWIPGYWHYDDDTSGFIWISGCWRAVPPGKSWVPGYWQETPQGYEWVMGFWKDSGVDNIVYLPAPPETLETGPSSAAPSPDSIWVPGCWVWQPGTVWRRGGYAWRPGFWVTARPDWVWVPAHYAYTPHGYVFVEGYWDYTLADRGVVFLPMRFRSSVYLRSGFCFSPRLVISADFIYSDFFFSPCRRHYFFGDYYGVRYSSLGFYPWFAYRHRVMIHDHLYAHARWRHRHEPHWSRQQRKDFEHRRQFKESRPPRTYRHDRPAADLRNQDRPPVRPINEITRDPKGRRKFEKLDQRQREEYGRRGKDMESYRRGRSKWENPSSEGPGRDSRPGDGERKPDSRWGGPSDRGARPEAKWQAGGTPVRERPAQRIPEPGEAAPTPGRERPGRPGQGDERPGRPGRPGQGDERPGRPGQGDAPPSGRERPSRSVPAEPQVVQTEQSKRLSGSSRPSVDRPLPGYNESRAKVLPARAVSGSAVYPRPAQPIPAPAEAAPPSLRERPSRSVPVEPQVVQTEKIKRLSGSRRPSVDRPLPGYSESQARVLPTRPASGSAVVRRQSRPQTVRVPESPIGSENYSDDEQGMPPELPQYQAPIRSRSAASSRSDGTRSIGSRRRGQSRP